jgi:serine phosphatase RsbU (regulator of sigma subunit)
MEEVLIAEEKQKFVETPKLKVKFSVKLKFGILISALCTIITLAITIYLLNRQRQDLLNEMRYRAFIISKNLAKNLVEVINDDTTRHQIIKDSANIKDIESIEIIGNDNYLIDHTDEEIWKKILFSKFDETVEKVRSKIQIENLKGYLEKEFIENGEEKFYILFPIELKESILGYIKINFTKREIISKIKSLEKKIIIFMLIAVFVSILFSYILTTIIIKPIKALSEGAVIIGSGNLDYKININRNDELGYLANEFNNMTKRLKIAQDSLIEKERYEEQLEIARQIQENLLPNKFPSLSEIEISAFYKAAKGVGGDYYDIIHIPENKQLFSIIADVSGKGVPAALVMVMIRTIFYSTAKADLEPNQILKSINSGVIGRLTADKFATVFTFNYNYSTGILEYSNAAHNPLILFKADTKKIFELDTEGVPVGIDEDVSFEMKKIKLNTNDIIVLNTDGITEAMNLKNELFRPERLKDLIMKNYNLSANELKDLIINEVNKFVGDAPQHDDMTLVIFKIKNIPKLSVSEKKSFINPLDPYSIII